jgi:flagellar hook-length control protein FliK
MEIAQLSVGTGNTSYKGNGVGEKAKRPEGTNTKINSDKYSSEEFSQELINASRNNKKSKVENKSEASNKDMKIKDKSKYYKVNSDEVDNSEEGVKNSEDIESLINLIIGLLKNSENNPIESELNSSDIISESGIKSNFQPLLELIGSEEKVNNLLELLNQVSLDGDVKNKVTELLVLINENFTDLKDSDEILSKLLTSEESVEPDELINQLQKIVSMKENSKEEAPLNILTKVVMKEETTDRSSSTNVIKDDEESNGTNSKFSKEEAILKKVINGDEKESKVTRAADFMSLFDNKVVESREVLSEKPVAITKSDFNNDVIKALSYMDKNGVKDLTVKIYPKELGEVSISVSMEQGTLKAMIKATSKETVEMLSLGLKDMNEKLNGNSIKIESVNIELYEEDTTYFTHENSQGKAYEDGGKRGNESGSKGSEENVGKDDVISEANSITSNEIDLLV